MTGPVGNPLANHIDNVTLANGAADNVRKRE
jgi:hypothetical protein